MTKIGIIICGRYERCAGGKCFRALRERRGGFEAYPPGEEVQVVGYTTCGGCPGGNVEYAPEEMRKNGAEVLHLATCMVVGYPPCPSLGHFKAFVETAYGLPVVVGTHPIPEKYLENHLRLPFWKERGMHELAGALMEESAEIRRSYN